MRQAKTAAKMVVDAPSAPRAARLVAALVDFWGSGAFRSALAKVPPPVWTIGELAREIRTIEVVPFQTGIELALVEPIPGGWLQVDYRTAVDGDWRRLVEVQIDNAEAVALVRRRFPCRSENLEGDGNQLGQRLVTTRIAATSEAEAALWAEALKHSATLAEFFVAAKLRIPDAWGVKGLFRRGEQVDLPTLGNTRLVTMGPEDLLKSVVRRAGEAKKPLVV